MKSFPKDSNYVSTYACARVVKPFSQLKGQWGRSFKQKGSAQQKSLPTPPIEISVLGIGFSIGGFDVSIGGFAFSKGGLEKPVPGLVKPASSTGGTGPGIFRLFAAFKRKALDTQNRPPSTAFCQASLPKPPPYQEKCKFFEKISMKGLAVSNPCPTFALAKRNKGTRPTVGNAL